MFWDVWIVPLVAITVNLWMDLDLGIVLNPQNPQLFP